MRRVASGSTVPIAVVMAVWASNPAYAQAACIPTYYDDCGSGSGMSYGSSPDSAYQEMMRQEREDRQRQQIERLERENRILREREAQRRRGRRETFGSPRESWGN